jgi:Resolvase, N terminal domain
MQIATPDLFVSDVVRAYHNSGLQTMYGVWRPSNLKRKTFSVHLTEPSNTLLPVNDAFLEMIVKEADRQNVSMAAFVRSVVADWFEKNPVAAAFRTEIHALKVDLYLHQQGIDTTTPSGKAMFQMMGVFSEFERSMIRERVRAGLARAKAEGTQLGRPRLDPEKAVMIRDHLAKGMTLGRVADGCGTSTVQRIRAEMTARSTVLASGSRASGFP